MLKFSKIIWFFRFPMMLLALQIILIMIFDIYNLFYWFDIPMHFFGGLTVGYSVLLTLNYLKKENYINANRFFMFVFAVSIVATIAVFWEFFEFGMDHLLGTHYQLSNTDTMKDLFMGFLGGTFSGIVFQMKKGK